MRMRCYLDDQRISCKPSTIGMYTSALGDLHAFLKHALRSNAIAARHIASIDRNTLDLYLAHLHDQRLAPCSAIRKFLAVKKYLAWEADRGTLNHASLDGFDRSRLPKMPDCLPRPLSLETDRILIDRLRTSHDPCARAFLLLRLTGLRISELVNLPNDCTVTTARNETFLKVPLGKMDNERLVPLNGETCEIIRSIRASRGIGCIPCNPKRLIGIDGNMPAAYRRLAALFRQFTAGISDQNRPITFHRLRHTYATSLLSGGVGIASIMKLLGHRRIEMSLRYAQITPTHLRNEYLKAMAAHESQYCPCDDPLIKSHPAFAAPADLIENLAAFIKKEAALDAPARCNLAKRLKRLHADLQRLRIPKNFPVFSL